MGPATFAAAAATAKYAPAPAAARAATAANARAPGETVQQHNDASTAAAANKAQLSATTRTMQSEGDAAGLLEQALGKLGGNNRGAGRAGAGGRGSS